MVSEDSKQLIVKGSREVVAASSMARLEKIHGRPLQAQEVDRVIKLLDLRDKYHPEKDQLNALADIITTAEANKQAEARKSATHSARISLIRAGTPIVVVLLSFLFATWLGGELQERSFNRQATFQAKLARYQEAQKTATEIRLDLRDVYYRISWDKERDAQSRRFDQFVRAQRQELERLEDILRSFPSKHRAELNKRILAVYDNIDSFLRQEGDLSMTPIRKLADEVSLSLITFLDNPN